MNTYTVTTRTDKHIISADFYTVDTYLSFWVATGASNAEKNVATFKEWIGVEKQSLEEVERADKQLASMQETNKMLMREHHQLLEISMQDLTKLRELQEENDKLRDKIKRVRELALGAL